VGAAITGRLRWDRFDERPVIDVIDARLDSAGAF
jgi:hypothetical protein